MEINNQILEVLGLSLVHSLWQGAALLFLVLLTLVSLRNRRAKTRYSVILFGILALPCLLALNLNYFWPDPVVDNSAAIESVALTNSLNLPTDFQQVSINPQSSSTVLWLKEHASTIAMLWFIGMALFLMKVIGSFVWMKRLTNRALPMKGEAINTLLERAKAVLGISKKIQLKSSSWIKSPVILGIIRPTILFPIGLIEGLSVEEVEAILYHELAHLKRNDFVINIIINVLQIIFFYHPAYWWLKSQLDNEREYATDELALQYSEKKLPMIKALAKVQAFSMNQPALAFAGNSKNQVLKRINIMMNSKQQPNWLSAIFTIAILLVAFGVMSVQDTNPKSEKKNEDFPSSVNIDLNSRNDSILVNIRNGSLEFDLDPKPQDNDSSAVSKAILEFVSSPESLKVSLNLSGEVTSITRNGSSLSGSELTVYKKAYAQLSSFSKKSNPTNGELEELKEQLKAREEEIARRQKNATQIFLDDNGKIDSVLVNGRLVEGEEKERYVKEFEQSKVYNSYTNQLQALETQYHQVGTQVEQLLNSQKPLDQNTLRQIKEYENRMAVLEHQIQQVRKATQYNRQIEQELQRRELEQKRSLENRTLLMDSSFTNSRVNFTLDENYEIEKILLNGEEINGEKKELALQEYRRHRELDVLSRERAKLGMIIQNYENQGMNNSEVQAQLINAHKKTDMLSTRISDTYKFIREHQAVLERNYASIGISHKMDSLSINHMLGNPTQSVLYLNDSNRDLLYSNAISNLERSKHVMIDLNGKLKKDWTLTALDEEIDVETIDQLILVKGETMYNYHSKRKLGDTSALLRVITKK